MILRRLTQSLKEQNWTAIWIEFILLVTGVFLAGYALARSFCELFREPDAAHALTKGLLTPGIAYSIPMFLLGVAFYVAARKRGADRIGDVT